jgi:hypothetical protein
VRKAELLNKSKLDLDKKPSCPFAKRCHSDSTVCGYIGYYSECPQSPEDRVLTEIRENVYKGVTPYDLFRAVRLNGKIAIR